MAIVTTRRIQLGSILALCLAPWLGSLALAADVGGVRLEHVRGQGMSGDLRRPEGPARDAAVLLLGAPGPIDPRLEPWAEALARAGLPSFTLAYGAGAKTLPVETVFLALDWLGRQDGIPRDRIAVVGLDAGAMLALVAATRTQRIIGLIVDGLPTKTPAADSAPTFSLNGAPLPPLDDIPIWRVRGPILVLGPAPADAFAILDQRHFAWPARAVEPAEAEASIVSLATRLGDRRGTRPSP